MVAHVGVVNEHTIGVLKNRWGSLKELRIQIKKKEDMSRVLLWVQGCVVLHNMLMEFGGEWEDCVFEDAPDQEPEEVPDTEDDDTYAFCRWVKRQAVEVGRRPGGFLWYHEQY
jgi:hypothetical protein